MIAEISLALQWEAGGVGSIPAEEQNSTCLKVQPKKKKDTGRVEEALLSRESLS